MKSKLLIFLLIACLLPISAISQQTDPNDDGEWYPFVIPEKLDTNSPMNIGKLVLDPPAGKHGFCKVKDGHFYFEDGTRAKFWGTNLCMGACFPTHEEAEMLANRIAFFGFNAVRLHHMDFYFEPRGIFKDVAPDQKDPQKKKTGVLSEKQLEKLDYLIYQLKLRGIYIDMNLLVSRHFTEADGVKDAQELGMAAKPVSMFDPILIDLQKKYAADLLTHYNPYTKLRYSDDPVLALVEITNENSILASWHNNELNGKFLGIKRNAIPNFYIERLDKLWNVWLQNKYGSLEKLKKAWARPDIIKNVTDVPLVTDQTDWHLEQHKGATASLTKTSEGYALVSQNITHTPWHLQFRTSNIHLVKNQSYTLEFTAKADKDTQLTTVCQASFNPYTNLGLSETVGLKPQLQHYKISFTALDDCDKTKLAFIFGYDLNKIIVNDISLKQAVNLELVELTTSSSFKFDRPLFKLLSLYSAQKKQDCIDFYIETERGFFKEMLATLREAIGIKVPITGIGGFWVPEEIDALNVCDFMDKHAYWDHPQFPNKPWDINDFTIHNKSIFQSSGLGIAGPLSEYGKEIMKLGFPYTVSEWNHCYPNQYAYETPLILAATASKKNWDAVFQFAFSHGSNNPPSFDEINDFLNIMPNPQQLILCSYGGLFFLRNQDIDLSITDSTYLISTKELVVTVSSKPRFAGVKIIFNGQEIFIGEIKNQNSGWINNRYNWGRNPILMKKVKF